MIFFNETMIDAGHPFRKYLGDLHVNHLSNTEFSRPHNLIYKMIQAQQHTDFQLWKPLLLQKRYFGIAFRQLIPVQAISLSQL